MIPEFSKLNRVPNDLESTCFACGKKNPYGFRLEFFSDEKKVYSRYRIPVHFNGWSNLSHGGILATLLDETMAWTAIYLEKKYILTKSLEIKFKKPVPVGSEVFLMGNIEEKVSKRERMVRALILNEQNEICVEGMGSIVVFSPEAFGHLNLTGKDFLERFEKEVFQKIPDDQEIIDP